MAEILESKGGAQASAIEQFENEYVGVRLSNEYRQFLLQYNGGRPEPAGFMLVDTAGPYNDAEVDWFMGIGNPAYDLAEWFDMYRSGEPRIPVELIPIAVDTVGNLICLAVTGPHTGAVFFWDHEREPDIVDWSNIDRIADSFERFIRNLVDFDEE